MSHEGIRIAPKEHEDHKDEELRPLPRIAVTPEKVRVLITEGKGMEIDSKSLAFEVADWPMQTLVSSGIWK